MIEDIVVSLKYSLMRDPCKRCLVRTMCSERCTESKLYYNHTEGIPNYYRGLLLCMVISIVGACVAIYRSIN